MNRERRQKMLIALLPALLGAGAYMHLYMRPATARIQALQKSVEEALASQPTPAQELEQRVAQMALQDQLEKAKKQRDPGKEPKTDPDGTAAPHDAGNLGGKLARLLESHGLLLVESKSGGVELAGPLPKSLEEQARLTPGRVRSLRFRGRYADVIAALGGIKDAVGNAITLKLTMATPTEGNETREWTLVLWI